MQPPPPEQRGTHVVTVHPNAHVLVGFPYAPHSSLLEFLRGEPKVLGAVQILLALITVGLGIILTVNSTLFSKNFPLVLLTAYPFWGPIIFIFTGYLTVNDKKSKKLRQSIRTMNITSSLAAAAGIILTIISYTQEHDFCQKPSLNGTCLIGRTLLLGLLSILFIISIVEFSISVTITSFRSKCWTQSNEVVFFLPSDVTKSSEQPAPVENAQLQFDHQEESCRFDISPHAKTVFFGGYAFFKLRHSRSPPSQGRSQPLGERTPPSPNEQQENISPYVKFLNGKIELNPLPSTSEARSPENEPTHQVSAAEQLKDEDLKYAIVHMPKEQAGEFQDQDLPLKAFPSPTAASLRDLPVEVLPPKALLMQAPPIQDIQSKSPSSHITESSDLTHKNASSKDKPPQEKPSEAVPVQDMLYEALMYSTEHPLQSSPDLKEQNIRAQSQHFSERIYQDILTEVTELTQDWKTPGMLSSDHTNKGGRSSRSHSLSLQTKRGKSPRRKSLNQKIRALLFSKKHPTDKKSQYTQTSEQFLDQQTEDWQAKGERSPKQQSKGGENKDQKAKKEQPPKKQTHGQQAEEEKSPKGQLKVWQAEGPQTGAEGVPKQPYQDSQHAVKQSPPWSTPDLKSQDWRSRGWRNKDGKAQDWQLQDKQLQEKDQDFQPRMMPKNATQTVSMQTRDINLAGMNHRDQKPVDTQSEDTEPDYHPSSQSVVQDTCLTCLSNMDSEQEIQQNASVCSGSIKDDLNIHSTSCSLKDDQQQSEDSD